MTAKRVEAARRRIAQHPDRDWWRTLFQKVAGTPFLRGKNPRGWTASLDWILENDTNVMRVLEGAYDGERAATVEGRALEVEAALLADGVDGAQPLLEGQHQ